MKIIGRKEAKSLGLKQYFTGRPCKHGHVDIRRVANGQCFECARLHCRVYHRNNPEKMHARSHAWRLANPERRDELIRAWRKANADRMRKTSKAWYRANRKRVAETHRARRLANLEKYRERWKIWAEANPEKRAQNDRNKRARIKGNGGRHTAADIADLYRLQRGRCAFFMRCGNYVKKKRHVDHIVPLVAGGSNDRRNLQILCPTCNLSKKAKDQIVWAQENGLLL